jgi:uncharacterized membrane protein YeaQ/YmgE (transglycosylase-associated protein family)
MGDVLLWLIIGVIAGGIASFIVPGRSPGGVVGAIIVGILGGLIGGWVLDALDVDNDLTWLGSLVVAIAGATALLYVMRSVDQTSRV